MEGVRAYDCSSFHQGCGNVSVVDVAGFAHLWCGDCRVYANLEAIATKFADYSSACGKGARAERKARAAAAPQEQEVTRG